MSDGIHDAAMNGDLSRLRELLKQDPGLVNARDDDGDTPLHVAAMYGQTEAIELLGELGADFNARNNYGSTPLHRAAAYGQTEAAKLLGELGAELEARDNKGQTPLHRAAACGETEMAKLLMELGADLEAKDNNGMTPLHWAAVHGETEAAKLLMKLGADPEVNARTDGGETPLDLAGNEEIKAVLRNPGAFSVSEPSVACVVQRESSRKRGELRAKKDKSKSI
jgi:ankyrin repeat protein